MSFNYPDGPIPSDEELEPEVQEVTWPAIMLMALALVVVAAAVLAGAL